MLEPFLNKFILLFVVIDPIGLVPIFAALTLGGADAYRRRMAIQGTALACAILVLFALGGSRLLSYLGVGVPAFGIAGGALLFLLAIDMVLARRTGLRSTTPAEQAETEHRADISVFPLAVPLIAGPGAFTTLLLLAEPGDALLDILGVLVTLLAVLLVTLLMLLATPQVMRLLGETGANVIGRVLGIVLAALAMQYILDGIRAAFAAA